MPQTSQTISDVIDEVFALLQHSGGEEYFGEAISKLQHAEQCAYQAQQAGGDEELILASLLHDIGHLLDVEGTIRDERVGVVNHDEIGQQWLEAHGFSKRVAALVGGHVDAKRYLTAVNPNYLARLSPASIETLRLQGGPMDSATAAQFAEVPELRDILRLRSWDEMAKDPEWKGPNLESYRDMLTRHLAAQAAAAN
ncbi:MAG: HD domain-containing protein [Acidobacteria bacterium]|nr:HD domain-containing protein [Acidobacteriota bacterium]